MLKVIKCAFSLCLETRRLCDQQAKTRKLSCRKDDRAMRPIYGCPENFGESLTTPMATFFTKFLMGFCSD